MRKSRAILLWWAEPAGLAKMSVRCRLPVARCSLAKACSATTRRSPRGRRRWPPAGKLWPVTKRRPRAGTHAPLCATGSGDGSGVTSPIPYRCGKWRQSSRTISGPRIGPSKPYTCWPNATPRPLGPGWRRRPASWRRTSGTLQASNRFAASIIIHGISKTHWHAGKTRTFRPCDWPSKTWFTPMAPATPRGRSTSSALQSCRRPSPRRGGRAAKLSALNGSSQPRSSSRCCARRRCWPTRSWTSIGCCW